MKKILIPILSLFLFSVAFANGPIEVRPSLKPSGTTAMTLATPGRPNLVLSGTATAKGEIIPGALLTKRQFLVVSVIGDSIGVREGAGWSELPQTDASNTVSGWKLAFVGGLSALNDQRIITLSNYAVSGYDTAELIASTQISSAIVDESDAVYVSIGTNDIVSPSYTMTIGDFKSNIDSIVSQITSAGKLCILCTIPPKSGVDWATDPFNTNIMLEINDYIRSKAVSNSLVLVADRFNSNIDKTEADIVQLTNHFTDGTHPDATGFIAQASDFSTQWGSVLVNNTLDRYAVGQFAYPYQYLLDTNADFTGWTQANGGSAVGAVATAGYGTQEPIYSAGPNEGLVRELPASIHDYVIESSIHQTQNSTAMIYFGCDASGAGYAVRIIQGDASDTTVSVVTTTDWTTVASVLTSATVGFIPYTGGIAASTFAYSVTIKDNQYVTFGYNIGTLGGDTARLSQPIINYDLGAPLGDVNLYYGIGSIAAYVYFDNVRLISKRSAGIVSPWSPVLAGSWEAAYESSTTRTPKVGWSGTMPWFADADAINVGGTDVATRNWARRPNADVENGSVVMSKVDNGDGTYAWRWTITASGAGSAAFRWYIPVSSVDVNNWYSWDTKIKMTPDTGDGMGCYDIVYRDTRTSTQVVTLSGTYADDTYIYSEQTFNISTPPVYLTQGTHLFYRILKINWSGAGTHVVDLNSISLRNISNLYNYVVGQ